MDRVRGRRGTNKVAQIKPGRHLRAEETPRHLSTFHIKNIGFKLQARRSGRFANPPQYFGENLPALLGTESYGFVGVILRLQNFGVIVALESRNR